MTQNHTNHEEIVWKEFDHNPITHSVGHYLSCVYDLKNKNGYARLTDVAKCLEISPGSCSTTIKSIIKKGLITEDKNKFLSLTDKGTEITEAIKNNSFLLKKFFQEVLKVDEHQAEIDACKMEHLLSLETAEKLKKFLEKDFKL
jgi:DtxR family Mn-dependent transcriptional regulator